MTRHTHPVSPEAGQMLFVDCPLCDDVAPLDVATGDLDCAACGVRLEVAPDMPVVELALAA